MMNFIRLIFGYCICCQRWFVYPRTRRQGSAYADDSQNFIRSCWRCYTHGEELWDEAWREYWSGCL